MTHDTVRAVISIYNDNSDLTTSLTPYERSLIPYRVERIGDVETKWRKARDDEFAEIEYFGSQPQNSLTPHLFYKDNKIFLRYKIKTSSTSPTVNQGWVRQHNYNDDHLSQFNTFNQKMLSNIKFNGQKYNHLKKYDEYMKEANKVICSDILTSDDYIYVPCDTIYKKNLNHTPESFTTFLFNPRKIYLARYISFSGDYYLSEDIEFSLKKFIKDPYARQLFPSTKVVQQTIKSLMLMHSAAKHLDKSIPDDTLLAYTRLKETVMDTNFTGFLDDDFNVYLNNLEEAQNEFEKHIVKLKLADTPSSPLGCLV